MKKSLAFILALLCFFTIISTSNHAFAADDYYSSAEGLLGKELLNELALISQKNHKKYTSYDDIKTLNQKSDRDPNNSNKLLDFYSGISVNAAWDGGTTWNREHVWPQSLSGGLYGTSGAGSDIHHIRPTISVINSTRGNDKFTDFNGEGSPYTYDGVLTAYRGNSLWEPIDNVKGDVARIIMYMYMHYSTEVAANKTYSKAGALSITNIVSISGGADGAWDMLIDWNELDPVDEFERNRHNVCVEATSVRNPFIDNEDYPRMIWDEDYVIDDGRERYNVTYHVEDDVIFDYVDSVKYLEGKLVKEPTVTPSLDGYRFDGWYKENEFINKWDFSIDIISSNLDLYAKFTELTFNDIFETSEIKSQLVFDIEKTESDASNVEGKVVIDKFINGAGSLSKGNYDLSQYMEVDTSLFDLEYKCNGAAYSYINQSNKEIRLYPKSGNGSSIQITAQDGVKIKVVKCDTSTPSITISSDGKTATIQNKSTATSGHIKVKSITIEYESKGSGYSYNIKEGTLALKYNLILTEAEYFKFLLSDVDLSLKLNDIKYEYDIYEYENAYHIVCTIYIEDYSKVYSPVFSFGDLENKINGYSAKTLANYYLKSLGSDSMVKEYKECLEEIIG